MTDFQMARGFLYQTVVLYWASRRVLAGRLSDGLASMRVWKRSSRRIISTACLRT